MNKTQLDNDVKFLITGSSTGTLDYSVADMTANENRHYDKIVSLILRTDNRWEWDDDNFETLPVATTNLVNGQADYGIASTSFLNLLRLELKDPAGNWILLKPISYEDKRGVAMTEWAKTAGTPQYYDKVGNSIILYPTPNFNSVMGLKVYYQRLPSYFISTDTTKEPGFSPLFHRLLSLGAAKDYAISNSLNNKLSVINNEITITEENLISFYSQRSKDEVPHISLKKENYNIE